jgi:hypothetical protein
MLRPLLVGFVFVLAIFPGLGRMAQAQPYCAMYSAGPPTCGIATLEICQQSISGVGGYCAPDQRSRIPPNLVERRRAQRGLARPPGYPGDTMPPPPQESRRW